MKIRLSELKKIIQEEITGSLHGDSPPKLGSRPEDELMIRLDQVMGIQFPEKLVNAIIGFDARNDNDNLFRNLIRAIDTADVGGTY